MKAEEIAGLINSKFPGKASAGPAESIDQTVFVEADSILAVAGFLASDPSLSFDLLRDMTAVDWLVTDEKKAKKLNVEPHLVVVYQLFSFKHKRNLTVKVKLPRWKGDKKGELPEIETVSTVWPIANWHEREIYDLLGVQFVNHPGLRRILCPEDWEGHALRKDYEFPLEYHGIRGK